MKLPAITPGPWGFVIPLSEDFAPFVTTSDGGDPLDASTLEGGNAAAEANAKAIAAVPVLLEALEQIAFAYHALHIARDIDPAESVALNKAYAALRLAGADE